MATLTICRDCKHHRGSGMVWYNQYCGASPLKKEINVVTGQEETRTGNPYAYCRDVNDGQCTLFEKG